SRPRGGHRAAAHARAERHRGGALGYGAHAPATGAIRSGSDAGSGTAGSADRSDGPGTVRVAIAVVTGIASTRPIDPTSVRTTSTAISPDVSARSGDWSTSHTVISRGSAAPTYANAIV